LFHFALLGALIFALFFARNPDAMAPDETAVIRIDDVAMAQVIARFEDTWNRPPTPEERANLLQAQIEEEILVRQALAMGLDQGDGIVRTRLAQKMRFLATAQAQSATPDTATLEAFLQDNAQRFERPATLSFQQVTLPAQAGPDEVAAMLGSLQAGRAPEGLGRMALLPASMSGATEARIDGQFGPGFAEALRAGPMQVWYGPVRSGLGAHLVRVDARTEPGLSPLSDQRGAVLLAWRSDLAERLSAAQIDAWRADYDIILPEGAGQ